MEYNVVAREVGGRVGEMKMYDIRMECCYTFFNT